MHYRTPTTNVFSQAESKSALNEQRQTDKLAIIAFGIAAGAVLVISASLLFVVAI